MPRNNRPYPEWFRQQMVDLYKSGRSAGELANEFGCHESSITAWAKERGFAIKCIRTARVDRTTPQTEASTNGVRHTSKGYGLVCQPQRDIHVVYALIKANQALLPVQKMCQTLKVSSSGFYAWLVRKPSERALANERLSQCIVAIHAQSDGPDGRPRIQAELRDEGIVANHKRIARLMQNNRIRGVSRRRAYVVTTRPDQRNAIAPDLVNRQFVATQINQLWVADMTYVPTWAGFLYLAVVMDVYSRKVVGWAFGEQMTADLVSEHSIWLC